MLFSALTILPGLMLLDSIDIGLNGCIFIFPHYYTMFEVAMITEISTDLKEKFQAVNDLIRKQKPISDFRKVFARSDKKWEQEESKFVDQTLGDAMAMHYRLTVLSKRMNEIFQFPILLTIAIVFETITMTTYYVLDQVSDINNSLFVLCVWPWPVVLFIEIFVIGNCFDALTIEVNGTECKIKSENDVKLEDQKNFNLHPPNME